MTKTLLKGAAFAALAVALAACGQKAEKAATETPPAAQQAQTQAPEPTPAATPDIVTVAQGAPELSTLVSLVTKAGLADTLKGAGPFTVFAPTDDAFKKLPAATLADLQKPENADKLKAILTYHVVAGKAVKAADIGASTEADTVQGGKLKAETTKDGVKVGAAKVVKADITAGNGVVHEIDTVLMPPAAAKPAAAKPAASTTK